EHLRQWVREHEEADRDRPADKQQRLEEPADRVGELVGPFPEIDRKDRKHHGQQRHRDEEERFEWLVSSGVPAGLLWSGDRIKDGLVDYEVEDGQHEGESER